MSGPRESLLRAVLDDPDAEAPRAAFAKWLDGQGDPQGEFIRLQLDASRERRTRGQSEGYHRLVEAADEIRKRHGRDWSRAVEAIAPEPRFYRGFAEGVTMDARQFIARADDLYRAAPVRHVYLTGAKDVVDELSASPHLARLVSLGLRNNALGDDEVRTIVASPHIARLRLLDLAFNDIGLAGLEALSATKSLPNLVHLNIVGNRVDDPREQFGEDWMTGRIVPGSIVLPELGRQLEAKYG